MGTRGFAYERRWVRYRDIDERTLGCAQRQGPMRSVQSEAEKVELDEEIEAIPWYDSFSRLIVSR